MKERILFNTFLPNRACQAVTTAPLLTVPPYLYMPEIQLWFQRRVNGIVNAQVGGSKAAAGPNLAGDLDA
jgi:hypothetical protein